MLCSASLRARLSDEGEDGGPPGGLRALEVPPAVDDHVAEVKLEEDLLGDSRVVARAAHEQPEEVRVLPRVDPVRPAHLAPRPGRAAPVERRLLFGGHERHRNACLRARGRRRHRLELVAEIAPLVFWTVEHLSQAGQVGRDGGRGAGSRCGSGGAARQG